MSSLNKIYFNHIPKTAGSFFNFNIRKILRDYNIQHKEYFIGDVDNINEEELINADLILGHLGIYPNIYHNSLTTVTMLRNPIDRLVSNYCMIYRNEGLDDLIEFNDWLFNDDIGYLTKNNLQCRFLTSKRMMYVTKKYPNVAEKTSNEFEVASQELHENGFAIEEGIVDYNNAKKYLENCELVMVSENAPIEIDKFFKLINYKWSIYIKGKTEPFGESLKSKKLRTLLNKKQIDKIISLNEIDVELYEYSKTLSSRFSI
jgi:hypothetical protein